MSFAQTFVLSNILGGGGGDTEDGTVATEALSRITDESVGTAITTSRSHEQAEVVREEMTYDVTQPPPVPVPADLANAVRAPGTTSTNGSAGSVSGGTLSEIESDASTSASTSVTSSSANEDTTISSMSMDDLSSITTGTSLDELSAAVIEMGSDAIGTTSTRTSDRASAGDTDNVGGHGENNEGQRWNRIGWPVLRSRSNMAVSDARSQDEDDAGGQTIVSSSQNTEHIDSPPDASSSADMLSFQPSMIDSSLDAPSSLRSPSEASTSLDSLSEASHPPDAAPAPPPPSQEAESPKAQSSPWPSQATGHDPTAFAAVGSSLLFPSRESGPDNKQGDWWKDLSEKDWERMASAAKAVLDSLEEENGEGCALPIPLPPTPPEFNDSDEFRPPNHDTRQAIISMLPSEFVCPICDDVMVGAAVLGCGCSRSTFCMQCIENGDPHSKPAACDTCAKDIVGVEDYVIVEKPPPHIEPLKCPPVSSGAASKSSPSKRPKSRHTCPSCKKADALLVPCSALDVAILNTIDAISTTHEEDGSVTDFKHDYYRRLRRWRDEVLGRRKVEEKESDKRRQEMLAMLIQAEEETIWKEKKQRDRRGGFWDCRSDAQCRERNSFAEVAFVVGAIAVAAVIGMKLIRRC
mmetsp:Transcript_7342/g.16354  ORF Transcript_7342/g.16354 Transcript_7342/m.16354 type:complete len:636 (-) Transcript_7342:1253-3160(-)